MRSRVVIDYHESVYEYLFTIKDLFERGGLADNEVDALKGKIEYFSGLLGEE